MKFIKRRKEFVAVIVLLLFIHLPRVPVSSAPIDRAAAGTDDNGMIEKESAGVKVKKKRSIWPYIIGGAVVAGVVVYLLVKNSNDDNKGPITTKGWGDRGSLEGQFNRPGSICVDDDGYVYVADPGNQRIQKFSQNGKFITQWRGLTGLRFNPYGMTIHNKKLYACDGATYNIIVFDLEGKILDSWPVPAPGGGSNPLPNGIAADTTGNLYVADFLNNRILKFDRQGTLLKTWGDGLGEDPGDIVLKRPIDVFFHDNEIFISDSKNYRIAVFDTNGNLLRQWPAYGNYFPAEMDIWSNNTLLVIQGYVPTVGHITWGSIQKYDLDGSHLGNIPSETENVFASPSGIAVNHRKKKIYITDFELHKVIVLDYK
jgi:DNA-binding beta-propeller fold protein YncE